VKAATFCLLVTPGNQQRLLAYAPSDQVSTPLSVFLDQQLLVLIFQSLEVDGTLQQSTG
jgi:hypothetical protein